MTRSASEQEVQRIIEASRKRLAGSLEKSGVGAGSVFDRGLSMASFERDVSSAMSKMAPFARDIERSRRSATSLGGLSGSGLGLDPAKRIPDIEGFVRDQEMSEAEVDEAFRRNAQWRLARAVTDVLAGQMPRYNPMLAASDAVGGEIRRVSPTGGRVYSAVAETIQDLPAGIEDLANSMWRLVSDSDLPLTDLTATSDVQRDRAIEEMYGDKEVPAGIRGAVQSSDFASDFTRGLTQVATMIATAGGGAGANLASWAGRARWLFGSAGPQAVVLSQAGRAGEAKGREYDDMIKALNRETRKANKVLVSAGLEPLPVMDHSSLERSGYAFAEAAQTYAVEWAGNLIQSKYLALGSRGLRGIPSDIKRPEKVSAMFTELAKGVGLSATSEGAEEFTQDVFSQLISAAMRPGDQDIDWNSALYSALVGASVGATFGGGGVLLSARGDRQRAADLTAADALREYRTGQSDVMAKSIGAAAVGRIMSGNPQRGDRERAARFAQALRRDGVNVGQLTGEDIANPEVARKIYEASPELARQVATNENIDSSRQMAEWLVGKDGRTTKDQRERFIENIHAAVRREDEVAIANAVNEVMPRFERLAEERAGIIGGIPANEQRRAAILGEIENLRKALDLLRRHAPENSVARQQLDDAIQQIEAYQTQASEQTSGPVDPEDMDSDIDEAVASAEAEAQAESAEPAAETAVDPEVEPATEPEVEPEVRPEAGPAAKPEAETEAEPEVEPQMSDKERAELNRRVFWAALGQAKEGNVDSQVIIGNQYRQGRGVDQSYEQAASWFSKAAEQGNAEAQNNLGEMYEYGLGVEQSDVRAAEMYRKAAEQGNAEAQNNLGRMYEDGRGVEQSDEQAFAWYSKAADNTESATYSSARMDAGRNRDRMFKEGRGVGQAQDAPESTQEAPAAKPAQDSEPEQETPQAEPQATQAQAAQEDPRPSAAEARDPDLEVFEKQVKSVNPDSVVREVEADTPLRRKTKKMVEKQGRRVRFVEVDGPSTVDGMISRDRSTVFVRVLPKASEDSMSTVQKRALLRHGYVQVALHETFHGSFADTPEVKRALIRLWSNDLSASLRESGWVIPDGDPSVEQEEAVVISASDPSAIDTSGVGSLLVDTGIVDRILDAARRVATSLFASNKSAQKVLLDAVKSQIKAAKAKSKRPTSSGRQGSSARPESRGGATQSQQAEAETPAEPATPVEPKSVGRGSTIRIPDYGDLNVVYIAVEAEDLEPSHIPTMDVSNGFAVNPRGDRNERPYDDPEAGRPGRETVVGMVGNWRGRGEIYSDADVATLGPPIIDQNGAVLGGNARTMGTILEYRREGNSVKEQTVDAAELFGLDPKTIEGMEKPVIVRRVVGEFKRGELSRALNYEVVTGRSAEVDALSIVNTLDAASLHDIARIASGFDTVAEFLSNQSAMIEVLGIMRTARVISQTQYNAIWNRTAKKVKDEGKAKMEMVLLAMAVPDIQHLQFLPPAIKNKILKSLPHLIRASAHFGKTWDSSMANAVEGIVIMKTQGGFKNVTEFIEQMALNPPPVSTDPHGIRIMHALMESGPLVLLNKMRAVTDAIIGDGQESMLGEDLSPEAAFREQFKSDIADNVEAKGEPVAFQQRGMKEFLDKRAVYEGRGAYRSNLGALLDFIASDPQAFNDIDGEYGSALASIARSSAMEKPRLRELRVEVSNRRERAVADRLGIYLSASDTAETILHEVAHALTLDTTTPVHYRMKTRFGKSPNGADYINAIRRVRDDYQSLESVGKARTYERSIAMLLDVYSQAIDQYLSEMPDKRRRIYVFEPGGIPSQFSEISDDFVVNNYTKRNVSRNGWVLFQRKDQRRRSGEALFGDSPSVADNAYRYEGRFNYEMANLDEFIAGAMSNVSFQSWLNSIQYKGSKRSLWRTLVEAVRGILGIPVKQDSLLESALSAIEGVAAKQDRIVPVSRPNPSSQGTLFQMRREIEKIDREYLAAMESGDTQMAADVMRRYANNLSLLDPVKFDEIFERAGEVVDGLSRMGKRGFNIGDQVYTPEMSRPNGRNWRVSSFTVGPDGAFANGHTEFDSWETARREATGHVFRLGMESVQSEQGNTPPSEAITPDTIRFDLPKVSFQERADLSRQRMREANPDLPGIRDKTFVSALQQSIENAPSKAMKPEGWRQYIQSLVSKGTVKADEVEWSGIMEGIGIIENLWEVAGKDFGSNPALEEIFDAKGRIRASRLASAASDSSVALEEVQYGNVGTKEFVAPRLGETRYDNYMLGDKFSGEGDVLLQSGAGMNEGLRPRYEEVALRVPSVSLDGNPFDKSHFGGRNVVAHARYSVRMDGDKTTLFVDEIQSDWGQQGRKRGFRKNENENGPKYVPDRGVILSHYGPEWTQSPEGKRIIAGKPEQSTLITTFQYQDTRRFGSIDELMGDLKGIASKAGVEVDLVLADSDFQHEYRFYASDAVEKRRQLGVVMLKSEDGSLYPITGVSSAVVDTSEQVPSGPFVDSTSKWVTLALKRIIARAVDIGADSITLPTGQAVQETVGGKVEGHTEFYENIVPKALKKLLKKMSDAGPITKSDMSIGSFTVDITPEMRESVYEGLPMFQQRTSNDQVSLSNWTKFRSAIVWEYTALEKAMKQLVDARGYIPGEQDPLALLQNLPGWVARDNDTFQRREFNPYQKALRAFAKKIHKGIRWKSKLAEVEMDVMQAAFLTHLPDLLEQIRVKKAEAIAKATTKKELARAEAMEETVLGLDEAAAAQMLDELREKYGSDFEGIEALGDRVRAMNARTLDMLRAEGIISNRVYSELKDRYPNYVPVATGLMSDDYRTQFVGASTISQPQNQLRKVFGGTAESEGRPVESLWAAQVMATDLDRRRANRKIRDNRAEMALYDLARVGLLNIDGQPLATAIEQPAEMRAKFKAELARLIKLRTKAKEEALDPEEISDLVPIAWDWARRQVRSDMGKQLSNKEVMRLRANKTIEDPAVVADINSLKARGVTVQEYVDGKTASSLKRTKSRIARMIQTREAQRYIYRKGDELFLRVNDKSLSDTLLLRTPDVATRLANNDEGGLLSTVAKSYLFLFVGKKMFLTAFSPMFWMREFMRQPFTVPINTDRMARQTGIDPDEAVREIRRRARIPVVSTLAKLFPVYKAIMLLSGKGKAKRGWQREFVEMLEKGGVSMSQMWSSSDMDTTEQRARRAIALAKQTGLTPERRIRRQIVALVRSTGFWVSMIPTAIDMLNRYEAYRAVKRASGGDMIRAGQVARESTIDFSKKAGSEIGKAANNWVTFFRAAVQGGDQLVKGIGTMRLSPSPRHIMNNLSRPAFLFIASGFMLELITLLYMDCEENPDDCIPDYQRNDNWVIPIPPRNEDGKIATVMIPKPYGFRVLSNVGMRAARVMMGKMTPVQASMETATEFMGQIGPVAIPDRDALDIVNAMAPLAGSLGGEQLVRLGINRDWRGMPIYMEPYGQDGSLDSRRARRDTPEFWSKIAEALHAVTGSPAEMLGGDRMDGMDYGLDVAPESLEYMFEGVVGTPARWASSATELLMNPEETLSKYERDVDVRPVIRVFVSETGSARAIRQQYSEMGRIFKTIKKDIDDAEGDPEEQRRRLEGYGERAIGYQTWKASQKALRSRSKSRPGLYEILKVARERGDTEAVNQIRDYIIEVQREVLIRIIEERNAQ